MGSWITLTNNETEYIIKLIKPVENRGILLKRATKNINCQEERFLRPLVRVGLQ